MENNPKIKASPSNSHESEPLAKVLSGRYGALALTRAAAQAAAAERSGDREQEALWRSVVTDLRQNVILAESWV